MAFMNNRKIFSNQEVNAGRQMELDIVKTLATLFMILNHCLMVTMGFHNNISTAVQIGIGKLLGAPFSAPVFMFSMGIGIVYSRDQSSNFLIKRGIKTILLGIIVNIGEFFVPHYLSGILLGEWNIFPIAGGLLLFCVDILAFAGMAMICMGLFKKLKLSAVKMVLIALVLSIAGSFLRFLDLGNDVLNLIAGYFIGSDGGFTAFPLFNWILFPVMGYFFGTYYIRCMDKKRFLSFWPIGLVLSTAYFVSSWYIPNGFLSEVHHYYFMTTFDAFVCLICIYGVIGFCRCLSQVLTDKQNYFITKIARNINKIYIIQWYLIPITFILICFFAKNVVFGDFLLIVLSFLEMAASVAISFLFKRFSIGAHK